MSSPTDVHIGHGTLYIGPESEAAPATPETAAAGNWVSVGEFHEDGLTVEADQTVVLVKSGQSIDPIKSFLDKREITIQTALMESSLESLVYAHGGADGGISTDAGPPATESWSPPSSITHRALLFRLTTGGNGYERDMYVKSAAATGAISLPFGPNATLVPCQWTAIKPASGNVLTVTDVTTPS